MRPTTAASIVKGAPAATFRRLELVVGQAAGRSRPMPFQESDAVRFPTCNSRSPQRVLRRTNERRTFRKSYAVSATENQILAMVEIDAADEVPTWLANIKSQDRRRELRIAEERAERAEAARVGGTVAAAAAAAAELAAAAALTASVQSVQQPAVFGKRTTNLGVQPSSHRRRGSRTAGSLLEHLDAWGQD